MPTSPRSSPRVAQGPSTSFTPSVRVQNSNDSGRISFQSEFVPPTPSPRENQGEIPPAKGGWGEMESAKPPHRLPELTAAPPTPAERQTQQNPTDGTETKIDVVTAVPNGKDADDRAQGQVLGHTPLPILPGISKAAMVKFRGLALIQAGLLAASSMALLIFQKEASDHVEGVPWQSVRTACVSSVFFVLMFGVIPNLVLVKEAHTVTPISFNSFSVMRFINWLAIVPLIMTGCALWAGDTFDDPLRDSTSSVFSWATPLAAAAFMASGFSGLSIHPYASNQVRIRVVVLHMMISLHGLCTYYPFEYAIYRGNTFVYRALIAWYIIGLYALVCIRNAEIWDFERLLVAVDVSGLAKVCAAPPSSRYLWRAVIGTLVSVGLVLTSLVTFGTDSADAGEEKLPVTSLFVTTHVVLLILAVVYVVLSTSVLKV